MNLYNELVDAYHGQTAEIKNLQLQVKGLSTQLRAVKKIQRKKSSEVLLEQKLRAAEQKCAEAEATATTLLCWQKRILLDKRMVPVIAGAAVVDFLKVNKITLEKVGDWVSSASLYEVFLRHFPVKSTQSMRAFVLIFCEHLGITSVKGGSRKDRMGFCVQWPGSKSRA